MPLEIFNNPGNTPIQKIDNYLGDISLFIKREDLIHPNVSGNKWRKLKYNIVEANRMGFKSILTFGGAFSNHIHATAAAGAACGLNTIGVIRGEILYPLNPTLQQAAQWGMKLISVSRTDFKQQSEPRFLSELESKFGKYYLLPEGGTNLLALKGCAEITNISENFDYWCVSCGTGGTLAGILTGLDSSSQVLGFPALKGAGFLKGQIKDLLKQAQVSPKCSWALVHDYHFNGYAKVTPELITFVKDFNQKYKILLDPIYTGKMMFGVIHSIQKGLFPSGSKILAIHTGGLQGIRGIEEKYGKKIN